MIVTDDSKRCRRCGEVKPRGEFYAERRNSDGLRGTCRACERMREKVRYDSPRRRAWREAYRDRWLPRRAENRRRRYATDPEFRARALQRNRERSRDAAKRFHDRVTARARRYGVAKQFILDLLEAQAGRCAACGDDIRAEFHLDHDHLTGAVRGLLCGRCNLALGHAKDDPARLRALAAYLERAAP